MTGADVSVYTKAQSDFPYVDFEDGEFEQG